SSFESRLMPGQSEWSAWYDRFVVIKDKAYSFERRRFLGPEASSLPQLQQISIYEIDTSAHSESGKPLKVATISATGEFDFTANRLIREPISYELFPLLEELAGSLKKAEEKTNSYNKRLAKRLLDAPKIEKGMKIPRNMGPIRGPSGDLHFDIRSSRDLLKAMLPERNTFRWIRSTPDYAFRPWTTYPIQDPQDPTKLREVWIPWRFRKYMAVELLERSWQSLRYYFSHDIKNPAPGNDYFHLQLSPSGDGQITVYGSDGKLKRIFTAGIQTSGWDTDQEIRQLKRDGLISDKTHTRQEQLQAAVERRSQNPDFPLKLDFQTAPQLDLGKIFSTSPEVNYRTPAIPAPIKITTLNQAWELIQAHLPGLDFLVSSPNDTHLDAYLRMGQPGLQFHLRRENHRQFNGEIVPRVNVSMRYGKQFHTLVFEDGMQRPDLAKKPITDAEALRGQIPRSRVTLALQTIPRAYSYYKYAGLSYGIASLVANPIQQIYEGLIYTPFERKQIGTSLPNLSLNYFLHDLALPFAVTSTASGISSVAIDGFYNMRPGLAQTWRTFANTEANLVQAYRYAQPSFFNPSSLSRPIANPFPIPRPIFKGSSIRSLLKQPLKKPLFRGLLQRAAPLLASSLALDLVEYGTLVSPMFWRNVRDAAVVSAASTFALRLVYSSSSLSAWATRRGWIQAAGAGAVDARFALTFRGGLYLSIAEMVAFNIINAHERRALLRKTGAALRRDLASAINRRNEWISRLRRDETLQPEDLVAAATADIELQSAEKTYRRFLELTDCRKGSGHPEALGLENEFEDVEARFQGALLFSDHNPAAELRAENERSQALIALRNREKSLQAELEALEEKYGGSSKSGRSTENIGKLLVQRLAENESSSAASPVEAAKSEPVRSPVTLKSPQGEIVLEKMRRKVANAPGFLRWSAEVKADYLINECGVAQGWSRPEAMAFLDLVAAADQQAKENFQAPPSMPDPEKYDTRRLQAMLDAESAIYQRHAANQPYIDKIAQRIPDNVEDFDSQMKDYYLRSNPAEAEGLGPFLPQPSAARTPSA
ncbi:MAG TPA: hypothetical protein DF383_09780, partial [Deltaproteobacteria bacterium]|nr:hypothetical protein [Deltaproteobacteria bacterium]